MSKMLELHEEMLKAAEINKKAEAEQEELMQFFYKYAETAEALLAKEGENYTEDDVVKLASWLIDQAVEKDAEAEKVAEIDESGRILARAFLDELNKSAKPE